MFQVIFNIAMCVGLVYLIRKIDYLELILNVLLAEFIEGETGYSVKEVTGIDVEEIRKDLKDELKNL